MLGRGSAEERIAYLFLHLTKRIAARNVIRDERYPIPLRQQHIANATGLTPVHVSRTLRLFREHKIVEFSSGILKVLDPPQFETLAHCDELKGVRQRLCDFRRWPRRASW